MAEIERQPALRRGWTTGACATAAARAAYIALLTGCFPDSVEILLPMERRVAFALAHRERTDRAATAGIIKDAGDDPDVTHGALILATVSRGQPDAGVQFVAGTGVGTVTKPGLPLAIGEPAINPMPREMMRKTIRDVAQEHGDCGDVRIEISVPNGGELAKNTLNGRLGIVGGLSILGTTGVVIPYSCAAWIATIYEGINIARAMGLTHVIGATGSTSEATAAALYDMTDTGLIDMGDFAGGMLRYLRRHPIPQVTVAGGFAKMAKLGQGHLDLHSQRSRLDHALLAEWVRQAGAPETLVDAVAQANTGLDALQICQRNAFDVARIVALRAQATAAATLGNSGIMVDVLVISREGVILAHAQ